MNTRNIRSIADFRYQCAIPVFDGLLPEPHNTIVLKLLFTCAQWHALAKLRMHTDRTLELLDIVTVRIGREFRRFTKKTCTAFETKELKRETLARKRWRLDQKTAISQTAPAWPQKKDDKGDRTLKMFNLRTVKYHFLGDYADTIHELGTTDSFSTEPVSHC